MKSFGAGMFVFPHGIHVDRDGNVWIVDSIPLGNVDPKAIAGKGHQVVKFSPEGKVLMTLGKAGVAGDRRIISTSRATSSTRRTATSSSRTATAGRTPTRRRARSRAS